MTRSATHTIRFLGTGAACGVPSFYCGCKACEEALQNPAARRGSAALLIQGSENTLIDAGPDLRMQLSLARVLEVERALFTHEHFDHIGGLPVLEYYVRLKSKKRFPLYAASHTLTTIEQQFAFMADTLEPHRLLAWQSVEFDGVCYTPLPAAHGEQTFGFLIEKQGLGEVNKKVAYFCDTARPAPEVLEELKGIDVLIIDATFNGSNWMPTAHLSIDEAAALSQELEAKKTFLTHLSMHYGEPITAEELQIQLSRYGGAVLAANDGLEITL